MKTQSIKLSPTDFDNLLWCATRYCVGRHSYVSSYAQDFWHVIRGNQEHLSKDRLEFFARDIRAGVSNCINNYGNVSVQYSFNDCIKIDALTLLASYVRDHPDQKEQETGYEVNCVTGEVISFPLDKRVGRSYNIPFQVCNEPDLPYWVLLANCIDRQYEITLKVNGTKRKELCVKHPIDDTFVTIDNWSTSICKEFIVDVKPLFWKGA